MAEHCCVSPEVRRDVATYGQLGNVQLFSSLVAAMISRSSFGPGTAGLEAKKLAVQSSKLAYVPKNKKPITGRDAEVCLGLIEGLDEHDDVQNVYTDAILTQEMAPDE